MTVYEVNNTALDHLAAQRRMIPIGQDELSSILEGVDKSDLESVVLRIGSSDLMLNDLELLADALHEYGLPAASVIHIIGEFFEQEIELQKIFEEASL